MAIKKKFPHRVATVYCNGGCHAAKKMDYQAASCEEAMQLCEGGPLECAYGCLGCGTCVAACKFDAIHINANGVAEVDEEKCINCGACIRKCPRKIIGSRLQDNSMVPLCSNKEKGPVVMKECTAGCIGCMLCQKNCPEGAITVTDFVASIDYDKCTGCGICTEKCPKKVIYFVDGKPKTAPNEAAPAEEKAN